MNYRIILLYIIYCFPLWCEAQVFNVFEADFVIKEKYINSKKTTLFKGTVLVNTLEQTSVFNLIFPFEERWHLKDSILYQYEKETIIKKVPIGHFDNFSLIKEISAAIKKDYGLSDIGFVQKNIISETDEIKVEWSPPEVMKEIFGSAITIISENLLRSVSLFNPQGDIVTTTFFEDYTFVKNYPVPAKIISKIVGDKDTAYKALEFNNIRINHQ